MPELPEVEVTRQRIAPLLLHRPLVRLSTTKPSYFFITPPQALRTKLVARRFVSLERIGKYLLGTLDDASRLLLHLGMTGQLFGEGAANPRLVRKHALIDEHQTPFAPDEHTHLVFHFVDAPAVYFRDTRKFGKVEWLAPGENSPRLTKLGPDALEISAGELHARHVLRRCGVHGTLRVRVSAGNLSVSGTWRRGFLHAGLMRCARPPTRTRASRR